MNTVPEGVEKYVKELEQKNTKPTPCAICGFNVKTWREHFVYLKGNKTGKIAVICPKNLEVTLKKGYSVAWNPNDASPQIPDRSAPAALPPEADLRASKGTTMTKQDWARYLGFTDIRGNPDLDAFEKQLFKNKA